MKYYIIHTYLLLLLVILSLRSVYGEKYALLIGRPNPHNFKLVEQDLVALFKNESESRFIGFAIYSDNIRSEDIDYNPDKRFTRPVSAIHFLDDLSFCNGLNKQKRQKMIEITELKVMLNIQSDYNIKSPDRFDVIITNSTALIITTSYERYTSLLGNIRVMTSDPIRNRLLKAD